MSYVSGAFLCAGERPASFLATETAMSIQVRCPHCSAQYTLHENLSGKKGRCKKCGESFMITAESTAPAPVAMKSAEPRPDTTHESRGDHAAPREFRRKGKKKKRRESRASDGAARRKLIATGVVLATILIMVGGMLWLFGGPRKPNLVGNWRGAPQVRQAVKDVTKEVAKGKDVNPLASGFAQALVQKAADQLLAVNIEFKSSGTAFYSGNTESIGMPAESDGPWEIIREEQDVLIVRMGPSDKPFEARLAFRDRDNFSFTRPDKPGQDPISFSRVRN